MRFESNAARGMEYKVEVIFVDQLGRRICPWFLEAEWKIPAVAGVNQSIGCDTRDDAATKLFWRFSKMTPADKLDAEFNSMCTGVAAHFVATGFDDGEDRLFDFAATTLVQALGGKNVSNENETMSPEEFLREIAAVEASREVDFVGDYLSKMVNSPEALRSNSRKLAMFAILTDAVCSLCCKTDKEGEFDVLHTGLCAADFYLVWDPNPDKFRAGIVDAFLKSGFTKFAKLAEAIRREETKAAIRALRRKLGLPGRRPARRSIPNPPRNFAEATDSTWPYVPVRGKK